MGIKARSAGHTTSPLHNITPSSAGDIPTYRTASTTYQAQTPHVLSPQQHQAQKPVPQQHQAALHDAFRTLHQLLKKVPKAEVPKAEQSTFADKAASLGLLVTLAAKARNEELYKLLLFAVTQLE